MSRSNPTLTNPAQHFFQWAGSKGQLTWYDKENKKDVLVKLPFEFLVLDQLSTIVGYNKAMQAGFWSNEVRNTRTDELFVRTKQGPFEAGLYENLVQTRSKGGKFAKTIYIAHKIGGEWVIGHIKASGSALSAWIEFSRSHTVENGKIIMERGEALEAETGIYYPPKFTYTNASEDEDRQAIELDRQVQAYLNTYLAAPKIDEDAHGVENYDDVGKATPEQQAEYEKLKAERKGRPVAYDGEEPINLDDIPF
jgi:hypothetical protein